jgi:hypothetical protein
MKDFKYFIEWLKLKVQEEVNGKYFNHKMGAILFFIIVLEFMK